MATKQPLTTTPRPVPIAPIRPAIDDSAARRLRMQRLALRISSSLDQLVRAEERAHGRLGHPVWTDRLRTR